MSEDPLAADREQRRREREERRRKREGDGSVQVPVAAPPPRPPAAPPPSRPSQPPRPPRGPAGRRRLGLFVGIALLFVGVAAIAALAYRHFHRSTPPPAPIVLRTVTVTIPEGYTRAQTAGLAKEEGLRGSYGQDSVHSQYLNPAKYGGKDAKDLEGFLFPDTFELKKHAPASDLVQLQLEDFKRRIAGVDMAYARSKNLTTYDVVTIASMVEHEAVSEGDRRKVAAVIYNRLHEGMPLGIDATTRFATGNYTRPLTESELAVKSPYNTRTHVGLPPGPIDSPGLASIEAAAHPAKVDYLFYVAEPGACNKLAFAKTEAEFEADAARYNSAREAAGGNAPNTCGK
jgi:cell division protein YceG involved in septum cleavage